MNNNSTHEGSDIPNSHTLTEADLRSTELDSAKKRIKELEARCFAWEDQWQKDTIGKDERIKELEAEVARLKEQLEFERLNVRTALNLSPSSAKDTPDNNGVRKPGYYKVRIDSVWEVAEWYVSDIHKQSFWYKTGRPYHYHDSDFQEIDETPITRQSSPVSVDINGKQNEK